MRRRFSIVLLVCLLAASTAFADEVRLQNGDRYSGTIVSLAAGTLTFKTANGTLLIPWAQVTAITADQPLLIKIGAADAVSATIATGATGTTLQPGGAVALGDITGIATPLPPLVIDGGLNAGFLATAGNTDINTLRLDGQLVARARANRYTFDAAINRAEDSDVETAENWNFAANYDRFLTTRLYVNGNGIFTHDAFRDLDLRTALGVGVGYQFIDTPIVRLSADVGVGWVNENLTIADDDSYSALRESAKLDVFAAARRLQFFHSHNGYFGVTGDDNLFFRMQNGVRISIAAGFVTTAQVDFDYDKSPAPGRRNTDRTFALTFGYRF